MLKFAALALIAALPHPTSPPSPYSADGQPHFAIAGGPARGLIYNADPFGDGSKVTVLGWYDTNGVVRFYASENPQLYNAPSRFAIGSPFAGVTRDPDGSLNGGVAVGALKPSSGESMTSNSAVGGEVFKEATQDQMERRRCNEPDEPDDSDKGFLSRTDTENLAIAAFLGGAAVFILVAAAKRR